MNLAAVVRDRGDAPAAEQYARQALEVFREKLPAGHWQTAEAESVLGGCLLDQGRLAEAEPLLTRSLPRLESERGEHSRYASEARDWCVRLATARGMDGDEASAWMLSLREDPEAVSAGCR